MTGGVGRRTDGMGARFLMVAFDGADGALLERWSADGTLPNLAALRARGCARRLTAPAGITDDGLWASFQYAAGLGEHGRYYYLQRLRSGAMGMAYRDEAGREAFWDGLSARGMRVAVFDVPKSRAPQPLNGIHLADWLVHGRYFETPQSYPPELAAEVLARFGKAPPSQCAYDSPALGDVEVREVAGHLRAAVAQKRAAALHYLGVEPWDLFIVGFKEAHCAGHALWDLADPGYPGHDAARARQLGHPMRTILSDLDAALGDLVAAAGPDAAIAVFSTTDMQINATLGHLMPEIVRRLNRNLGETWFDRAAARVGRLAGARPLDRCELLPYSENAVALRINAPVGAKGKDKAAMLEAVTADLAGLTDADSGRPVIAAIGRPATEHPGARAAGLPDLLIQPLPGAVPRTVTSPRLGRIAAAPPHLRPGNHAAGGLLILAGVPVAAAAEVRGMEDFGGLAARVLDTAE